MIHSTVLASMSKEYEPHTVFRGGSRAAGGIFSLPLFTNGLEVGIVAVSQTCSPAPAQPARLPMDELG
ncbi:MAG: hypothetical protein ACK4E4_03835 [Rhodocyclaceae bacterium]